MNEVDARDLPLFSWEDPFWRCLRERQLVPRFLPWLDFNLSLFKCLEYVGVAEIPVVSDTIPNWDEVLLETIAARDKALFQVLYKDETQTLRWKTYGQDEWPLKATFAKWLRSTSTLSYDVLLDDSSYLSLARQQQFQHLVYELQVRRFVNQQRLRCSGSSLLQQQLDARPHKVVLVGRARIGKTTFLNSLLGTQMPAVGGQTPVTASALTFRFSRDKIFTAQVELQTLEDWRVQMRQLLDLAEDKLASPKQASQKEGRQLQAAVKREITKTIGKVEGWDTLPLPAASANEYQRFSSTPVSASSMDELLEKLLSVCPQPDKAGSQSLSSLTRNILFTGDFPVLSSGVELVDLPGILESDIGRQDIITRAIMTADTVLLMMKSSEGETEFATADDLGMASQLEYFESALPLKDFWKKTIIVGLAYDQPTELKVVTNHYAEHMRRLVPRAREFLPPFVATSAHKALGVYEMRRIVECLGFQGITLATWGRFHFVRELKTVIARNVSNERQKRVGRERLEKALKDLQNRLLEDLTKVTYVGSDTTFSEELKDGRRLRSYLRAATLDYKAGEFPSLLRRCLKPFSQLWEQRFSTATKSFRDWLENTKTDSQLTRFVQQKLLPDLEKKRRFHSTWTRLYAERTPDVQKFFLRSSQRLSEDTRRAKGARTLRWMKEEFTLVSQDILSKLREQLELEIKALMPGLPSSRGEGKADTKTLAENADRLHGRIKDILKTYPLVIPVTSKVFLIEVDADRILYHGEWAHLKQAVEPQEPDILQYLYSCVSGPEFVPKVLLATPVLLTEYASFTAHDLLQDTTSVSRTLVPAQAIEALRFCHRSQITHGDIKLSNMAFFRGRFFPQLKLLDFGSALDFRQVQKQSILSATTEYLPPKVKIGSKVTFAEACALDCWALGVTLQEFLKDDKSDRFKSFILTLCPKDWRSARIPASNDPFLKGYQTLDLKAAEDAVRTEMQNSPQLEHLKAAYDNWDLQGLFEQVGSLLATIPGRTAHVSKKFGFELFCSCMCHVALSLVVDKEHMIRSEQKVNGFWCDLLLWGGKPSSKVVVVEYKDSKDTVQSALKQIYDRGYASFVKEFGEENISCAGVQFGRKDNAYTITEIEVISLAELKLRYAKV